MTYGRLSAQELGGAIEQTREAIRRAQDLLEIGSREPITQGLEKVADTLPSLLEELIDDLKELEKAKDEGAESESDDDEDDDNDDDDDEED